jgi:ABC-type antimicrobial peptide transport system permease subunit
MRRSMTGRSASLVRWRDPATYAVVSLGLIGTTVVACYLPARRVLFVDPAVSLRSD